MTLKDLREIRGLTQEEVGNLLGVHPQGVSNFERRRAGVPKKHIGTLSKIYKTTREEIEANSGREIKKHKR